MARLLRNASPLNFSFFKHKGFWSLMPGISNQTNGFSSKGRRKLKSGSGFEENVSKKEVALRKALDQISSSFGKGSIMWLGRSVCSNHVPVVSTGSFALDIALGTGGLPRGRIVEIFGPEASGKTTLALHVIAESQKEGGYCAFIDAERALDPALAKSIGVDTSKLLLSQPDSGEQALSLVDTLIRRGSVDVVIVDSVAALVPKNEFDGAVGDSHMAIRARLMSQTLRKLTHSLSSSQTLLVFINQVRSNISTFEGFGGPTEVTCGGNALKSYASVRLNVKSIGLITKLDETVGSQVLVKIVKNKLAPPFRSAQFELEFGKGICRETEIIDLGLKHKFISKAGSNYSFNGQSFRGKDTLKRFLNEHESAREEFIIKLREKLLCVEKSEEAHAVDEDFAIV
ncbi:DNA repair protein recA-like 3, mitochondrial, partial [Cucurbita argyrosperma subsp. sororia]